MKVGVIGAGTMGAGICEVFAKAGWDVAMTASSAASAQKHKDKLAAGYAKRVAKGKMAQEKADAILAKIVPGAKEDVCGDCDLIVECSKEEMGMKKSIFTDLMGIVGPDCMFATNTSSLSITEIANGLDRPVIGMHFFNPAPVMKLVEVIAAEQTPQEMVDKIVEISKELGKTPVVVKEAAGFVVNRILVPLTSLWQLWTFCMQNSQTASIVPAPCCARRFALASWASRLAKASSSTKLNCLCSKLGEVPSPG